MKKYTSKAFALIMTAALVLGTVACGSSSTTQGSSSQEASTAAAETGTGTQIANPITEVGEEEMVEQTGIDLPAPDGATDVRYSIIDMGENEYPIAQVDFTVDGKTFFLRAQTTDLTTLNTVDQDGNTVKEEDLDYSVGDISGIYADWTESGIATVQNREAIYNVSADGYGYIAWLDAVPGILYNLGMVENADTATLQTYAEKVFVPLQSDFAPEGSTAE